MYPDVPLWLSIVLLAGGFVALAWSSDYFVAGASSLAKAMGISPFIIGMVIIGFGTSAPELCVSALSGIGGKSNLSLGNAYGSCVFNIAAILGVTAAIRPVIVKPATAFIAGPALAALAGASLWLLSDGSCSRMNGFMLLSLFAVILPAYCWFDQKCGAKAESAPAPAEIADQVTVGTSVFKLVVGLVVLVASSHILVWGAVDLAKSLGVSDLMVGLTVIAVGTSLPELASAIASARRGENEFVTGNIVGSNLFNTLAVVGLASLISPAEGFSRYILTRDLPVMIAFSLAILIFGANWRRPRENGRVTRMEGVLWLAVFMAYMAVMVGQEVRLGRNPAPSPMPALGSEPLP